MTWVSSCCDGLPANPDAPLSGNFCGKCHDHCEDWYDMDATDPALDVLPILTPEAWGHALSDFERDTIQRNREQNPFLLGMRPSDDIALAAYWPQDTREREESRALELEIMTRSNADADAQERDWMRQGRD